MQNIDDIDRRLLRLLQNDATRSIPDLAEAAGLSAAPCWRRIEKLEKAGVIRERRVVIDKKKLGFEVQVFLRINTTQ